MADPMAPMAPEAAAPAEQGQGGDIGKLIEGVGMGLQKLAEMLPPEMQAQMAELVTDFQDVLAGKPEEGESEEAPAAAAAPMQGRMDAMANKNAKPVY